MKPAPDKPRLHPQSWTELRMLVRLHGADEIQRALDQIRAEEKKEKST